VDQRIAGETVEQTEDVIHSQAAFASVDKLDRAPRLQIDARNQQVEWISPSGERKFLVRRDIS